MDAPPCSLLLAQYEALSQLFSKGWQPRRSIVLSHGFDEEEVQARQGAGELAKHLEATYGHDSMLLLIDEGSSATRIFGTAIATPATSEKGYIDVELTVATPGGHSSVPPAHTGIGILSELIVAIEQQPWAPGFDGPSDPLLQFAMCAAEHASHSIPAAWKRHIRHRDWEGLARAFSEMGVGNKALVSTTQAFDVVRGGVKVNALPELASATMNHRIRFGQSVQNVKDHLSKIARPIAKRHNLTLVDFDEAGERTGNRYLQLEVQGLALEPAPRTPTDGAVWDMFAGSIRHVHRDENNGDQPYVVSPGATTGNTDTKVYWNLTRWVMIGTAGVA